MVDRSECKMTKEDLKELKDWMIGREMDIATSNADFGELQSVFRALFGRDARDCVPLEEYLNGEVEKEAVESFNGLFGK